MTDIQIKCFLALSEKLSYTAAAKELGIAQPTLSAHIKALEKNVGFALFSRTSRRVSLSPEGEILRESLGAVPDIISGAVSKARDFYNYHKNILRIGYTEGTNSDVFLADIVAGITEENPDIKIEITRMTNVRLVEMLDDGQLDVIVTPDRVLTLRPDLDGQAVYTSPTCIMYEAAGAQDVPASEMWNWLLDQPFIVQSRMADLTEGDYFKWLCTEFDIVPKSVIEVNSIESKLLNVKFGLGVCVIDHACRKYGNPKYGFYDIPGIFTKYAAIIKHRSHIPELKLFLSHLRRGK